MSLFFVVSTGRCGSTLLSRILHAHPDVLNINELFSSVIYRGWFTGEPDGREFWQRMADPSWLRDALVRDGIAPPEYLYPYETGRFNPSSGVPAISHMTLPMLTNRPDALFDELAAEVPRWPSAPPAEQYRRLFAWFARRYHRQVVVERSGGSLRYLRELRQALPEARFIYLSRDGVDCALSMSRHTGFRGPALVRELTSAPAGRLAPAPELLGLLRPPHDTRPIVEHDIPLVSFGAMWSAMTCQGTAELSSLDTHSWTAVRYEELVADPKTAAIRLADFLEITAPPEWTSWIAGHVDGSRVGKFARLNSAQQDALQAACAPGNEADRILRERFCADRPSGFGRKPGRE